MNLHQIDPGVLVANEPGLQDLSVLARRGVKALVDNRIDDGDYGAASFSALKEEAGRLGLVYVHEPVRYGGGLEESLQRLRGTLSTLPRPVLLFCGSAVRSATAFMQSQRVSA